MGKAISIGVASDTREFSTGIKSGVIKPLEGAVDALDDLADGGEKAGRKLEGSMDDARKETSEFKKEQSELAKAMQKASKTGGDSYKTNVKKGTDGAGEALDDLKTESRNAAKETAASFDGSAESIADGFQGAAAEAFMGFGPAGVAAGLVIAAGIGIGSKAVEGMAENTEQVKERVAELAAEFITAGEDGAAGLDFMIGKLQELATETDKNKPGLSKLKDLADRSGSSFEDLAGAYVGNTKGLKDLWREGDRYRKQLENEADELDTTTNAGVARYEVLIKQADAQRAYMDYLGQSLGVSEKAAEAERLYAEAGGPALEYKAQRIEAIDAAYDDAAGAVEDYTNKESGLFDTEAYITAMLEKEEALRNYQDTLAHSSLTPAAKAFLDSQGQEAAATFLQGYKAATPAQRTELGRIWDEAGETASGSFTKSLRAGIPTSVKGPTVAVVPSTTAFDAAMRRLRQIRLNVPVVGVDRQGRVIV